MSYVANTSCRVCFSVITTNFFQCYRKSFPVLPPHFSMVTTNVSMVTTWCRFGVDPAFSWFFPDVCHDVFPPLIQISFSVLEHTHTHTHTPLAWARGSSALDAWSDQWWCGETVVGGKLPLLFLWSCHESCSSIWSKKSKPSPGQKVCHPYVHQGRKTTPQKSNYSNKKVDATFPPYCFILLAI